MTRNQFDEYFALEFGSDAAEGYSADDLEILNDRVFEALAEYDVDFLHDNRSIVNNAWDRAHNGFSRN